MGHIMIRSRFIGRAVSRDALVPGDLFIGQENGRTLLGLRIERRGEEYALVLREFEQHRREGNVPLGARLLRHGRATR
jgi:hypothetical protein